MAVVMALLCVSLAAIAADIPKPGERAPDFILPDYDGRARTLNEHRGKWVVLFFFRDAEGKADGEQARGYRDLHPSFTELGAEIIGVSIDPPDTLARLAEINGLPYTLLADTEGEVAAKYGSLSNWTVVKYAKRNTFVIDPEGRIAHPFVKVVPARDAAEILEFLKNLTGR